MSTRDEKPMVDEVEEVQFSELHPDDTLVLETENSVYRFSLVDTEMRVGKLEGGAVDAPREAIASGVLGMEDQEFWGDGLRRGSRALFFMASPTNIKGFNRLLTSEIEHIRIDHGNHGRRAA